MSKQNPTVSEIKAHRAAVARRKTRNPKPARSRTQQEQNEIVTLTRARLGGRLLESVKMKTYTVTANGIDMGEYPAHNEQHARDLCARDAGYKNEADMVARLEQPSELVAVAMGVE